MKDKKKLENTNTNENQTEVQYVDEFGNPIDPSLVDESGNYIGDGQNVQSQALDQSQIANQIGAAAGNMSDEEMTMVTGVETEPISSSEHQMDNKELFDGMVTFDYNNVPITDIVNSIILDAINKGASDIHFDPFDEGIKIRIRIDGQLNDYSIVPLYVKKNMITRIKIIAGMNITESRTPQDGAIRTELANKTIDLRVSCLPTNLGEKIVIRIMDYSMSAAGVEGLDFSEENLEKVNKMLALPNGIILVTGATGSGKSTTVYSMLQKINTEDTNIITVEDPIEMNIGGINQVQAVAEIGLDFATALRSILRQDPDVIMIGEIRDEETAKIAVRASITGHIVLSTIHTNNSLNTIERLTDMNVERYLLGSALSGIISQKLSRRLCEKCKKLRPANDYEKEMFKKILDKDIEEIYEPVGCPECSKGYRGRIAIQEVLLLNQAIKDAIIKGSNKATLRRLVYGKNGTITMLADGLNKVLEGKTSFEEILKLIDLDDDLGSGTELGLEDQIDATNITDVQTAQPAQAAVTGPININLTPELLAGLQIPQVVRPIIVDSDDLDDDEELDEKTEKTLFQKLKNRKKKKKPAIKEKPIIEEEPEVEEELEIEEISKEDESEQEIDIIENEIDSTETDIEEIPMATEQQDEIETDDEEVIDIQINDDEIHDDDKIIELNESDEDKEVQEIVIEDDDNQEEEIIKLEDENTDILDELKLEDEIKEDIEVIDEPLEEETLELDLKKDKKDKKDKKKKKDKSKNKGKENKKDKKSNKDKKDNEEDTIVDIADMLNEIVEEETKAQEDSIEKDITSEEDSIEPDIKSEEDSVELDIKSEEDSIENDEDIDIDDILDAEFEDIDAILDNLTSFDINNDSLDQDLSNLSDNEIEDTLQAISEEDILSELNVAPEDDVNKVMEINLDNQIDINSEEKELIEDDYNAIDDSIIDTLLDGITETDEI